MESNIWKKFELKMVAIILFITVSFALSFYFLIYDQYYNLTIEKLQDDAHIIHQYVEDIIGEDSFLELNTIEDEEKEIYLTTHKQLDDIRRIANILYLYTAKRNSQGEYIYVLDGLDRGAEDFRHVGDSIEEEIIPNLEKSLNDEAVLDNRILVTDWGIVYVAYFPVHDRNGNVLGAIGMEFDCETLYNSFNRVKVLTIVISLVLAAVFMFIAIALLKRVVRNTEAFLLKKDQLLIAAKEEALESSKAKSDFLSRMSHEIRTPMNAIIGMSAIADNTKDIGKIKHCLATIRASSAQLLNLINDILDMSKIESGKFELDSAPFNIEKMLMQVCNLVIDKAEQKHQKFDIFLSGNMSMNYIGDELRISQIVTNLLSNAVKFTPDEGIVTLSLDESRQEDNCGILHFSVTDTGIGITPKQLESLFTSFEQADGSISRKFGGTGLGLAISKSLVEKMNGKIWVESEMDKGSEFHVEIPLERLPEKDCAIVFGGITPSDLNVLIVDGDLNTRQHFSAVMDSFKIHTDLAESGEAAIKLVKVANERQKAYDVVFLDCNLPDKDGLESASELMKLINKNTIVIMASFTEWNKIEEKAGNLGIKHYIAKPLFPSSILDAINEVIGSAVTSMKMETADIEPAGAADFSEVTVLIAEDIEINREIIATLLEETRVTIDFAETGTIAVEKFKANPDRYDMIFMDIQMPELDGYQATINIRGLDKPRAKEIPIIAMTANAFKEDVNKCLSCGMNDHLAKPINYLDVIDKIAFYK